MKTSIVMATYNGSKYLAEQLDSIFDQSILPNEIIIADDQSTDSTFSILTKYSSSNYNIDYIVIKNQYNLGYANNFNNILLKASGDLIFLCDQDDFWFRNKIEFITSILLQDSKIKLIINNAIFCDENLVSSNKSKLDIIEKTTGGRQNWVMGCCVAVTKDFLELVLPIPTYCCDHDDWIVTISRFARLIKEIEEPLQFYRRHSSNSSKLQINNFSKLTLINRFLLRFENLVVHYPGYDKRLFQKRDFYRELLQFFNVNKRSLENLNCDYLNYHNDILAELEKNILIVEFKISLFGDFSFLQFLKSFSVLKLKVFPIFIKEIGKKYIYKLSLFDL